ncbi:transcription termination factor 4, mitochondrial isoform X5 [Dromiciops gliroides]|uniref:transcription termination factor 4, mitochondrial isoform X5 n=1 Tax=Dromiciops gliroides TaxID=33562 RepID=UPI001CC34DCA|nr:transcription termination factor 4, mitochondrial isoform X5 [Dromiciops gliroides]
MLAVQLRAAGLEPWSSFSLGSCCAPPPTGGWDREGVLRWHRLVPFPCLLRLPDVWKAPSQVCGRRGLTAASSGGHSAELAFLSSKNPCSEEQDSGKNIVRLLGPEQGTEEPEEAVRLLLDMGFSQTHVMELFRIRAGIRPQQMLAVVSELLLLGLDPDPVCKALQKNPRILQLTGKQLKNRAGHLRRLGLGGASFRFWGNPDIPTPPDSQEKRVTNTDQGHLQERVFSWEAQWSRRENAGPGVKKTWVKIQRQTLTLWPWLLPRTYLCSVLIPHLMGWEVSAVTLA